MKKKLLALAVAGAFVAPVAAMADNTIYGVANLSYDSTSTSSGNSLAAGAGTATASASQIKVSSNSSRIGFKGTEDLGGGTNAIYQIETQVYMDNSATTGAGTSLGNRNTFVGLSGESWGTVLLGRNDTPYKTSTRRLDLFADGIADNRSLMGGVPGAATAGVVNTTTNIGVTASAMGFDVRPGDVIQYNSPNLSGFNASAQYVAGAETAASTGTKGSAYSLAGTYEAGPIYVALAYQHNNIGALGSGTLGGSATTTDNKESAWKLGGSYTMDQFQVNLVYEHTKDDLNKGVAGQTEDLLGHHVWYLSGKFNVSGNDAVKLAYTNMGQVNAGGVAATQNNTGAKQISLGYDHAMSKRTTVYALYTKLNNDTNSKYNLSNAVGVSTGAVTPSGFNADPSAVSIGIKHTF